ncbi:Rab5 GDP/GTP exchange factor [Papilio machaon]|uniref:Rab5 GDP/GTP exchange factor n=1 Tax=Papilio machaon TaxID=76193 RepID=A0A0N1I6I1_PAPMA|nr:Rab5 GDP/GTP exchange factor [Papilio machaon]
MPSLRIDQSDLKCKNGCDYYGNPQWQGYCSKCHREQLQRQRRAEKASAASASATLPRQEQKKPERGLKLSSHSSFSKFEEKRLRQSETLKKANLLKFSVFKKSSADEHEQSERRPQEFKVPSMVNEGMKRDFRARFPQLPSQVDRDARVFAHSFIMDVIKCSNVMSVDELSERVQRQYQRFMRHMDTSQHFAGLDQDTKELLIDFVEKHVMTYLHELPGVVFSPAGTEDERADRAMSERIQQLGWVGERHLDCDLDRSNAACRQLLYKAISELLGMDGCAAPGGKLARVRRCCRHVLALAGPPASADDLLPRLIFTCCAVSFIENLTAESLNMDKQEFDCYMAMPASIGGSAWAAALSLCACAREAEEQRAHAQRLLQQLDEIDSRSNTLADNAASFEEQIAKKVQDVLAKTPLEIKPRRELPRFGKFKSIAATPLIDIDTPTSASDPAPTTPHQTENNEIQKEHEIPVVETTVVEDKQDILDFQVLEKPSPSKSPNNVDEKWDLKQTNSMELLTPSPLGFTPFDSRSIDELVTPEDFGTENLAPGLSNINYDIDLSDFSGDNSLAEDPPKSEPKDPFSPDGIKKDFDPFAPLPSRSEYSAILETFDEFSLVDARNVSSEAFEVVHRGRDPFSPVLTEHRHPFNTANQHTSLLDDKESPTAECLLPSPLQPQTSKSN